MLGFPWWRKRENESAKKVDKLKKELFDAADDSSRNSKKAGEELNRRKVDIAFMIYLSTNGKGKKR